jgi:hypothetical protein
LKYKFKKIVLVGAMIFSLAMPNKSQADFWGGDTVVLTQILANAVKQLIELNKIIENGRSQLGLLRDINRGLNDSLNLARTINPNIDPGLYKDWQNTADAIFKLQSIYGIVTASPDARVYRDTDQGVAEAVNLNNDVYKYTHEIDELSETIKDFSHVVSPGGAQKLTAQTLGVMLQVMNQSLRTQATGLKLQAQSVALQNKKDKDSTKEYLATANVLKTAMKTERIQFQAPRF